MQKFSASFEFELAAHALAIAYCGVDEVAVGPLAAPSRRRVILDPQYPPRSGGFQSLTPPGANALTPPPHFGAVLRRPASVEEIDQRTCGQPSAMERAVAGLPQSPCHILIDGNLIPAT